MAASFSWKSLAFVAALSLAACAAPAADPDHGDYGDTSHAMLSGCALSRDQILASADGARREAIERAFTWYDAQVPYSQSATHEGYRTDCSGFVSMCWQLGQSYTTADFYDGGGESFELSGYSELAPGDALVHRSGGSGHIVLFLGWNDDSQSSACVIEEANSSSDMQFGARSTDALQSGGYKAIRAEKLRDATAASPSASTGADVDPQQESQQDPQAGEDPDASGFECYDDIDCF